jgi:hypothetical protein
MKTVKEEQTLNILRAVEKLQNMPTFQPYESHGLKMSWGDNKFYPFTKMVSPKEQEQNYKLRWIAEALMGSLDSPKSYFLRQVPRYKEWYKNSPKVLEALQVVEKFI